MSNQLQGRGREVLSRIRWKTDQDYAGRRLRTRINELPEVFVFGQQDAVFDNRQFDDLNISGTRSYFDDGQDIESSRAQRPDDVEVTTLVGQQPHARRLVFWRYDDGLFVRQGVCGVSDRRANIVSCQLGIRV